MLDSKPLALHYPISHLSVHFPNPEKELPTSPILSLPNPTRNNSTQSIIKKPEKGNRRETGA